jgi:phosphoribosyl-ATP pyrophosphohydrolase
MRGLMRFSLECIAALEDEQFARNCEKILSISFRAQDFLVELSSPIKFKVIVESDQLFGNIREIMVFPLDYIAALENGQFEGTCARIVTMSEEAQDFLVRLRSPDKFKVIVESEQLFGNIREIMKFPLNYIATLENGQFEGTCARIVTMPKEAQDFLVGLRFSSEFKVIVESAQLLGNIYKFIGLSEEYKRYIDSLTLQQFRTIYERIVVMPEEARNFLIELRSSDKFEVIVESEQLVWHIGKIMKFSSEYIAALSNDKFARTIERILMLPIVAQDFLLRLESAVKFKIIMEEEYLSENVSQLSECNAVDLAICDLEWFVISHDVPTSFDFTNSSNLQSTVVLLGLLERIDSLDGILQIPENIANRVFVHLHSFLGELADSIFTPFNCRLKNLVERSLNLIEKLGKTNDIYLEVKQKIGRYKVFFECLSYIPPSEVPTVEYENEREIMELKVLLCEKFPDFTKIASLVKIISSKGKLHVIPKQINDKLLRRLHWRVFMGNVSTEQVLEGLRTIKNLGRFEEVRFSAERLCRLRNISLTDI